MPMNAEQALDAYFLEMRSGAIELAATLDRIGRGRGHEKVKSDERLLKLSEAFQILAAGEPACVERVQRIFSLPI